MVIVPMEVSLSYEPLPMNVPDGTNNIAMEIDYAFGQSEPVLQTKSVSYTPTESIITSSVTYDQGYDGLNAVDITVGAISSTYVGTGVTRRTAADLTVNGSKITAPKGYYSSAVSKAVGKGTATTPSTTINPTINLSVTNNGVVTASFYTQRAITPTVTPGYINEGTAGNIFVSSYVTRTLPTMTGATIYPGSEVLVIPSQYWLTGDITFESVEMGSYTLDTLPDWIDAWTVSVTPYLAISAGYISDAFVYGSAVNISATDVTYGNLFISSNDYGIDVVSYATVDVDVPGIIVDPIEITSNGTYTASSGFAFSPVVVSVSGGGGGSGQEDNIINRTISGLYTNSTVTTIGSYAFAYCSQLQSVSFQNATRMSSMAFYYCSGLLTASFPNLTTMGSSAFYSCTKLTAVSIPNVTIIPSYAFHNCQSLASIEGPKVTYISGYAFRSCYRLSTVSFESIANISLYGFASCSSLMAASFPRLISISSYAFYGCINLSNAYMPSLTTIGSSAFGACSKLATIDAPNVSIIYPMAFASCWSLASISFSKLSSIGSSAFRSCSALSIANIKSVSYIGTSAFTYCSNLKSLEFNNMVSIEAGGFMFCNTLNTLIFNNDAIIQPSAFSGCQSLMSVYMLGSIVARAGISIFHNTPMMNSTFTGAYGSIFVPESLVASYKADTYWSVYSNRITSYNGR